MIILSTIVGILLFVAGSIGLILTWINYPMATLNWIEGHLTYGMFCILGLAVIAIIVMTPRET